MNTAQNISRSSRREEALTFILAGTDFRASSRRLLQEIYGDALGVHFSNSAPRTPHSAFIAHDGWAQLAPFGDFPGQAMLRQADGSIKKFPAIQRLDRAAAELMVAKFKSPWQRLKRYFTGYPIYAGHPDVPAHASAHPDKTPKGMIVDLQVRAEGLFCKPVFTNEGSELVETRQLRAFSPYWTATEIGEQPGPDGQPIKIFRPELLNSAGLTNNPNLPVQLLNERTDATGRAGGASVLASHRCGSAAAPLFPHPFAPIGGEGARRADEGAACENIGALNAIDARPLTPALSPDGGEGEESRANTQLLPSINNQLSTINPLMNKQLILDFLATQGVTLANEATDEQLSAALHQLGERVTIAETTLASRQLELESTRADLANERQFHTDTLLDAALVAGRITAAQRPDWAARLQTDFANAATALAQLTPTLKTTALTLNLGARKAEIANANDRRDALDTLLKAEMAVNGGDYDRAFATVRKNNPALFAAMKQPSN